MFEYIILRRETAPAGQVYLGTFLAFALFFSFFFGNLLFFLIVFIISIFIFLEKEDSVGDEWGNIKVGFYEYYFKYGKKEYDYGECLSFTIHEELFGQFEKNIRITFKSGSRQDLFISIPDTVQTRNIYDIIRKSVKEDPAKELTFTEQIVLRFF
jgi:hypothetical protein